MFCATCGSTVDGQLNFCKNCGAKIAKEGEETPKTLFETTLQTISYTVLGALGILVGLSFVLLKNGFEPKNVTIIAVFYLASLTAICFMLLGQLPKIVGAQKNDRRSAPEPYQAPALPPRTTAQLNEHLEPAVSVTENTTRNFEKVPRGEIREK